MLCEHLDHIACQAGGSVNCYLLYLTQVRQGLERVGQEVARAHPAALRVVQHGQERFFDARASDVAGISKIVWGLHVKRTIRPSGSCGRRKAVGLQKRRDRSGIQLAPGVVARNAGAVASQVLSEIGAFLEQERDYDGHGCPVAGRCPASIIFLYCSSGAHPSPDAATARHSCKIACSSIIVGGNR